MRFIMKVIAASVAVWVATLIPALHLTVSGENGSASEWWAQASIFVFVGLVLTVLNTFIKPVVKLLSLPLLVLTLGLFSVIISWFILWLTGWLTSFFSFAQLNTGSFWQTLFAALIIGVVASIMEWILPGKDRKDD